MNRLAILALLCACAPAPAQSTLLVVLDDVGAEYLSFTPQGQDAGSPAYTPTLDSIAASGLVFDNAWSAPNCSPTRAQILTGLYAHRTGIGAVIKPHYPSPVGLDLAEVTLPERLSVRGYATALFGKWHLSNDADDPCDQGFDFWSGTQGNISDYYLWPELVDLEGVAALPGLVTEYATKRTTDTTLNWIWAQRGNWFAMVSYNAAHKPYHTPPGFGSVSKHDQYRDTIAYLDAEIGRLIAGLNLSETTVIIIGDNGSPEAVAMWPNTAATTKGEVYRGSIEVPLLVTGQAVTRAISAGWNTAGQRFAGHINAVDVFRTVLRLSTGNDPGGWDPVDSIAFIRKGVFRDDARDFNFSERFKPLGAPPGGPYDLLRRAVEQDGYKSIWREDGSVEVYDVLLDPWELNDIAGTSSGIISQHASLIGSIGL